MVTRSKSDIRKPIKKKLSLHAFAPIMVIEPTCYSQANRDPRWHQAMAEEFTALLKNHTWTTVPLEPHMNVVRSTWKYCVKYHAEGSIERFKAQVVARGFYQKLRINYHETFILVTKPSTIRLILSIAFSSKWPSRQLDLKNAFLHGELNEEVFMRQPLVLFILFSLDMFVACISPFMV